MASHTILITGGTGMVGTQLKSLLEANGFTVKILSRKSNHKKGIYTWDIEKGYIEAQAWEGVTSVIHLAGAGVADKRWTDARKKEILDSRVLSTRLLFDEIKTRSIQLESFVSATAIGYYGFDTGDVLIDETASSGDGFLSEVTVAWENEINEIASLGIRTVLLRIGIVLSAEGGALVEMAKPVQFGLGAPLGSGRQWMSWIHIADLCNLFLFSVQNLSLQGVFNAVAPHPVQNEAFMESLAKAIGRPYFLPKVPAFVMRLIVGEMAQMIIGGNKVSADKVLGYGFKFQFAKLKMALDDLAKQM